MSSGSIEQDPSKRICSFHTYEWAVEQEHINAAKTSGNTMLEQANAFLESYESVLQPEQVNNLRNAMNTLRNKMNAQDPKAADITNATTSLSNLLSTMQEYVKNLPPEPTPNPEG